MAIKEIPGTKPKEYTGLSSDEKTSNYLNGVKLHTVDTGEHWIFHDGMWGLDLTLIQALKMASL